MLAVQVHLDRKQLNFDFSLRPRQSAGPVLSARSGHADGIHGEWQAPCAELGVALYRATFGCCLQVL